MRGARRVELGQRVDQRSRELRRRGQVQLLVRAGTCRAAAARVSGSRRAPRVRIPPVPWDLNAGDMVGVLDDDSCGRGRGLEEAREVTRFTSEATDGLAKPDQRKTDPQVVFLEPG